VIDGAVKRTVTSGAVRLAVVEAGERGRPTIVLVHGYPDTKKMWSRVLPLLAARFHVAAYDVRGAGASSAPRGPAAYDFERLADDLAAVIAAVSPDEPVHLVGHDWGGIAGWEQVAMPRLHGRIASFTTIAGPSLAQVSVGLRAQLRRGRLLQVARRVRRSWYVLALCTPGIPTLAWRGYLGRLGWRRHLERVEGDVVDGSYPAATLAEDAIRGANLYRRNILFRLLARPRPGVVPVPVQLIVPSDDHFISSEYYERAAEHAPALLRRTVPGSHWALRAHPELVAEWIASFVDEVREKESAR
jgi:pimeloyl-ACP methyl ester carboxylesterase